MALAVVLLVGSGLLIRSYERLQQVHPGFDPDGVVTFNLSLPEAKYPTATRVGGFTASLVSQLQAEPGVEAAAVVFGLPFAGEFSASTSFRKPSQPDIADGPSAGMRVVTPDYFETMRIPLLAGRLFDAHDDEASPEVVLINQRTARRFFPDEDPVGQQIRVGVRLVRDARSNNKTIVGVVGDVKYGRLDAERPRNLPAVCPAAGRRVHHRGARLGGSNAVDAGAAPRVAAIDRELPIAQIEPMAAVIGASIAERRFTMFLLTAFAAVAVALAAIGIYGVLAYLVSQRTQEIGVRLAIGATPGNVVSLFVRESAVLTLAGIACGLAGAVAVTRALSTMLFGVTATDPATFVAVAGALALVALLASYVPARRAATSTRSRRSEMTSADDCRGVADDEADQRTRGDDFEVVLALHRGHQVSEERADQHTEDQYRRKRPPLFREYADQNADDQPFDRRSDHDPDNLRTRLGR